jgi:hypothetical protein
LWKWLSADFRGSHGEARIVCKGYIRGSKERETSPISVEEGNMAYAWKNSEREQKSGENQGSEPAQRK